MKKPTIDFILPFNNTFSLSNSSILSFNDSFSPFVWFFTTFVFLLLFPFSYFSIISTIFSNDTFKLEIVGPLSKLFVEELVAKVTFVEMDNLKLSFTYWYINLVNTTIP